MGPPLIFPVPLWSREPSARSQIELPLFSHGLVGSKWHSVNENDSFNYNPQYTSDLNALYFGTWPSFNTSSKLSSKQLKLVKQKVTGLNLSVVDWKIWYSEQEPPQPQLEYNSPYVPAEGSGGELGNCPSTLLSLLVHKTGMG